MDVGAIFAARGAAGGRGGRRGVTAKLEAPKRTPKPTRERPEPNPAEASAAFATSASASAATRNSCAAPGRSPVARKCVTDASRDSYAVVQPSGSGTTETETDADAEPEIFAPPEPPPVPPLPPPVPPLPAPPLFASRCSTTYPRTTEPFRFAGGLHRTLADSGVICEKDGASGGSGGAARVRNARGSDGGPNPASLPARTRARIVSPGSRPATTARASDPRYTTIQPAPAASSSSSSEASTSSRAGAGRDFREGFFFFLDGEDEGAPAPRETPSPAPVFGLVPAGTRRASRTYTSGAECEPRRRFPRFPRFPSPFPFSSSSFGARHANSTASLRRLAARGGAGAAGGAASVSARDGGEGRDRPAAFTADTRNAYARRGASPRIVA